MHSPRSFTVQAIGVVHADRSEAEDDYWGGAQSRIELGEDFDPEALAGIEEFSHVEVLFCFDRVSEDRIVRDARHPRGNKDWPRVGIFAQRGKNRPNRLGSTVARILGRDGRNLFVEELDAIDGTPVLDLKPVMAEFLPRGELRQPEWSRALMAEYWLRR
jgi:tRNA-Thr(GGU) m(6)t(6)A37 methyltransferase TsaA